METVIIESIIFSIMLFSLIFWMENDLMTKQQKIKEKKGEGEKNAL